MASQSTHFTQAFMGSKNGERSCNQIVWDNVGALPAAVSADPLKDLDETMLASNGMEFGSCVPCIDTVYYVGGNTCEKPWLLFVLCVPTRHFIFNKLIRKRIEN
jgi:hypothetical protein